MTQFSFQRLDDGKTWGVKASANLDGATRYAGRTVDVRKRDGSIQSVTLGRLVAQWNGGRAAVYAIAHSRPFGLRTSPYIATIAAVTPMRRTSR